MPSPVVDLPWSLLRRISRARVFVARHPGIYWLVVGSVAAGSALAVDHRLDRVDDARAAWGASRAVLVAVRDLEPGSALDPLSVVTRLLPAAALPGGAGDELPADAIALHRIVAGEVVLRHHVAPGTGAAGRLPPGTAGILVPAVGLQMQLAVDDVVDVVGIDDPLGGQTGGTGSVLAPGGVVIATTEDALVVAVPEAVAAGAAAAAASGRAVLVLRRAPASVLAAP
ncbi:MAG: SAF domain-containing protein [Acidimicrobiia bacterium]